MIKLADEYEAYIDEILGDCFNEYKFHMEFYSEWITTNLPADITLGELWENKWTVIYTRLLPIILLVERLI